MSPRGKRANKSLNVAKGPSAAAATKGRADGGELVARLLESQKVKYLFAINGGHPVPILPPPRARGGELPHLRHQQARASAAGAPAGATRPPGAGGGSAGRR